MSHVADYAAAGPRIAYPELTAVVVMTATTAPTPVGLAIGSETPEEIAVSVAAQLLRERNPPVAPSPADPLGRRHFSGVVCLVYGSVGSPYSCQEE